MAVAVESIIAEHVPVDTPLPAGWTEVQQDGKRLFVNRALEKTTWHDPRITSKYSHGLPPNWEVAIGGDMSIYYIDHATKTTSRVHPGNKKKKKAEEAPAADGDVEQPLETEDAQPKDEPVVDPARVQIAKAKRISRRSSQQDAFKKMKQSMATIGTTIGDSRES